MVLYIFDRDLILAQHEMFQHLKVGEVRAYGRALSLGNGRDVGDLHLAGYGVYCPVKFAVRLILDLATSRLRARLVNFRLRFRV